MPTTPEQKARRKIDRLLEQCGWVLQDYDEMNISAAVGVAIREFPLSGTGHADYMLYADGQAIGIVEAKPEGYTLTGVETQSAKYVTGFPAHLPRWSLPLPFAYESTGTVTQFTSALDPEARSREVFAFHRPEELIRLVDVMQPTPDDTVVDPAVGTGGFLLAAQKYVVDRYGKDLDPDQKKHMKRSFVTGWELVAATARLCIMNLYLHGIDAEPCPIKSGADSLASDPGERFSLCLTNPPFGKKSSISVVTEEGELEKDDTAYERQDFWVTTKNKQLNFVQHIKTLLKINGRAAVVLPDNVLFEGGAGETVRRNLMKQCDVHTLLRLPTGIFYAQGVKANVLFFDNKPAQEAAWTKKLWVYDLRTNMHFTQKERPLKRADLDDFVTCFNPANRHRRKATWSEEKPEGRWRAYDYDELLKRDKASLDLFWLRDTSLEDSDDLPEPDVLAQEIADDLQTATDLFLSISAALKD